MNVIRKIWKFIWITVTGLIGLLLLLLLIISQLDINRFKETIENQITELTGRQLTIDGDLRLDLSMQPLIRIEKVSFANALWGRQPQMLSVDLLQLKIKLRPLLDNKLIVEQLLLEGVDLSVESNDEGKINWELDSFSSDESGESEPFELPLLPILQQVQFDAIHFYYGDVVENIEIDVVLNLQLSQPAIDKPVQLSANGMVNKHPFDISAETGFLSVVTTQNLADQSIKLKADADALGVKVAVDGVIERPVSAEGINITLSIEADDLDKTFISAISQSIYQYLPKTEQQMSLNFSAGLTDSDGGYDFSDIKLKLADTDITGDVSYKGQANGPVITAKIHSDKVNLNQFLAEPMEKSELPGRVQQKIETELMSFELPDTDLPFELLEVLDTEIIYSVDEFQFSDFSAETIMLNVSLNKGLLHIERFDFKFDGAPIKSTLMIDSGAALPRINIEAHVDKLQLGHVLQSFEIEQFKSGILSSKIKLKAQGRSVKSLLSGLKGKGKFQLDDASLNFSVEDKKHSADIDKFSLSFSGIDKPVVYKLKGNIDAEPLSLAGDLDSPLSVINNKRLKLKLKLAAVKINLEADGSISQPLNMGSAKLDILLDIPAPKESILKISRIVPTVKPNKNIPDLPVKLRGQLTASPKVIRFEQMKLIAGKSDLSGDVYIDLREEKTFIKAKLESQLLDLNELVPATIQVSEEEKIKKSEKKSKEKKKSKKTKLFSTAPLPVLDALDMIDVDLKYKLSKLISNEHSVDRIDLNLIIKDSRLMIDPLSIEFAQGAIITKVNLDSVSKTQFDLDSKIIKLRYDRLMAILGTREYAKGELDAEIKLSGKGESVSELMASLDGSVRMTTVDGELNQNSLKLLSKDLESMIPFTETSDRQKINCGVVQFNINDGVAETHSMVVNTGAISALGTGDIDLSNETLSLYIAPRTKHTSLLMVALVPVNVTGPLSAPSIKPDVVGSTVSTTKTVTDIGLTVATAGVWLLAEDATNKLWGKFVDDTDYCARALAGDRIVPARIKLESEDEDEEEGDEDAEVTDLLDDDEYGF
jgi:uncharacterized protein involved in outer membrane biogenesis